MPKLRISYSCSADETVLTTLHTETAAATVPQLIDLIIEGFLEIGSSQASNNGNFGCYVIDLQVPHKLSSEIIQTDPHFAAINFKTSKQIMAYRSRSNVFKILEGRSTSWSNLGGSAPTKPRC